jgi:hypothetical protein
MLYTLVAASTNSTSNTHLHQLFLRQLAAHTSGTNSTSNTHLHQLFLRQLAAHTSGTTE